MSTPYIRKINSGKKNSKKKGRGKKNKRKPSNAKYEIVQVLRAATSYNKNVGE
jgi:hypothetical protein